MLERLKHLAATLKREADVYRRVLRHPRTPWAAKALLALALGYLLLPFDLVPDFLPVVGQLDDLVIVPGLIWLALRLIPPDVVAECRATTDAPAARIHWWPMASKFVFPVLFLIVLVSPFVVRLAVGDAPAEDKSPAHATLPERRLVIVTPHNPDIRNAFQIAFSDWHARKYGSRVRIDFILPGGTNDIVRLLKSTYDALKVDGKLPPIDAVAAQTQYDMVWGGGDYTFDREIETIPALQPITLPPGVLEAAFPEPTLAGIKLYDQDGDGMHWVGVCLSSFGIVYSPFVYDRLAAASGEPMPPPKTWSDLTDPRLAGKIALADPGSSGSAAVAYMMVLQRAMADAETAFFDAGHTKESPGYAAAVAEGWRRGMGTLTNIAAGARYFADSAQAVPPDVSSANCAAGMAIDFYGQVESELAGSDRIKYVSPPAATAITPDPIAVLYGTTGERLETAEHFVEFLLSPEGQDLWIKRAGTPGGPPLHALRRPPIRRDVYADRTDWSETTDPFADAGGFNQRNDWMVEFTETRIVWQAGWIDAEESLHAAYDAVIAVPDANRRAALMGELRALPKWRDGVLDFAAVKALRDERKKQGDREPAWNARTRIDLADAYRAHYDAVRAKAARQQ